MSITACWPSPSRSGRLAASAATNRRAAKRRCSSPVGHSSRSAGLAAARRAPRHLFELGPAAPEVGQMPDLERNGAAEIAAMDPPEIVLADLAQRVPAGVAMAA